MTELEQILQHLRTLQARGWPIQIDRPHKMQTGVIYPGQGPIKHYILPLEGFGDWLARFVPEEMSLTHKEGFKEA